MSLAVALLIFAQSVAPQVAQTSDTSSTARARPVVEQVRASARVLRPARIVFSQEQASAQENANARVNGVQRTSDAAGTVWVEFN
ncbi:hypothetical protein EH31_14325 [Erythrobacter longus]|uniref:Uncharacterized protein n=1 Tax=Erythrobacter longus TaxID=1044 RepID=A0A074M744_ERYLO|nr:hypothetical protein [Erythrobacter longus]KEO89204.1 hypothetical protein EH31_14325 [Erythrobacter longus]